MSQLISFVFLDKEKRKTQIMKLGPSKGGGGTLTPTKTPDWEHWEYEEKLG